MRFDNCLHNAISGNLSAGNGSAAASTYYGILLAASSDNMVRGSAIRHSTRYLSATATAGSDTTITFPNSGDVSALNDWYNGLEIKISSGTGSGQTRTISDYVGSTRVATVSVDWTTNLMLPAFSGAQRRVSTARSISTAHQIGIGTWTTTAAMLRRFWILAPVT